MPVAVFEGDSKLARSAATNCISLLEVNWTSAPNSPLASRINTNANRNGSLKPAIVGVAKTAKASNPVGANWLTMICMRILR